MSTDTSDSIYRTTERLEYDFGVYEGGTIRKPGLGVLRDGRGELRYRSGNVYTGEWRLGAPNGRGTKLYANGDRYDGEWANGKRHGDGKYAFAAGHTYEGGYVDDECAGRGVFRTVHGDVYDGEWEHGKKHGVGVETMRDGQCFSGRWRAGKKEGLGELRTRDGARRQGLWRNDSCVESFPVPGSEDDDEVGGDGGHGVDGGDEVVAPTSVVATRRHGRSGAARPASELKPLVDETMLRELAAVGVDTTSLMSLALFSDKVGQGVRNIVSGVDSMAAHIDALAGVLDDLVVAIDADAPAGDADDDDDDAGATKGAPAGERSGGES